MKTKDTPETPDSNAVDFIRGYYCCIASILQSHGDNQHITDNLNNAGSDEEIIKYADDGDVETIQDHGYLSKNVKLNRR